MQQHKIVVVGTTVVALLLAMAALTLPVPDTWQLPAATFYLQLAAYAILTCFHIGAAVLFTMNLGVYKAKLREAYVAIASGMVLTAAGTLQVPIVGALDIWQSPWVRQGGLILPFVVSSLMLYLATQHLARLVNIKHPLTYFWIILPIALLLSLGSSFLPHVDTSVQEISFDVALAGITWSTFLVVCASIIVFRIRQHTGTHYTPAMTWLAAALFNNFLILGIQFIYTLTATNSTGPLAQFSTVLAILSGFLWLRAGYAFARTKDYEIHGSLLQALFGQQENIVAKHPETVLDMVTYAAGLASNTTAIDPMLDTMRAITAKLKPGESPSASDTKSLIATYLTIEQYLTTQEAIRTYTKKELRAQLDPTLQKLLTSHGANA